MSRSTALKLTKELFTGTHLVAITEARPHEGSAVIKFSDGQNKSFEKVYDFTSSEFLKMCYSAGTIKDNSIFDAKGDIGKRLLITISEVWVDTDTVKFELTDTAKYDENVLKENWAVFTQDEIGAMKDYSFPNEIQPKIRDSFDLPPVKTPKAKIIAEQREMIKKVESGIKEPAPAKAVEDDLDSM